MNGLHLSRNIHDAVHGLIRMTAEEMAVIDHPLFQRLRWICQTGLLKLVYPTATHTRFEHSTGAMHVAQTMLDALFQESEKSPEKLYPIAEASPGQAIRIHELPDGTATSLQRLVRLAALVHDLGHGPLSHAFETFTSRTTDIEKFLSDARLAPITPFRKELLRSKSGRIVHEAVSCIMFAKIWDEIGGEPWVPGAVAAVLLGGDAPIAEPSLQPWIPLVRDLVSSAPIDADRMDYLLRDSGAAGVTYGLYEPGRLLKSILCVRGIDGGSPAYRLGWRESGLPAVENFVMARFQMYRQIYHHKTVRAIELMLHTIRREAEDAKLVIIDTASLRSFLDAYAGLSDETFLRTLAERTRPGRMCNGRIAEIAEQILLRRLWTCVYEFRNKEFDEAGIRAFVEAMRSRHPDRTFIADRIPLKAMKDLDRGAYLLPLDPNRTYSRTRNDLSWLDASPQMRMLTEEEQSLTRLFMETEVAPEKPCVVTKVKVSALQIAGEHRATRA